MSRTGHLWIGGLEPYMSECFLLNALSLMGEEYVTGVKLLRNKFTGELANYGFIKFDSDASALMAMHKLNGKIIPNTQPPIRFQLNHASAKQSGLAYSGREYSVWVSDLPADITDQDFRKAFSSRYASIECAKVQRETNGRVHGFVRFTDLNDQRECLIHMNGFRGFSGQKPVKVTMAIPKFSMSHASSSSDDCYSHLYESYWSDRGAWGNYGSYQGHHTRSVHQNATLPDSFCQLSVVPGEAEADTAAEDSEEHVLIEHSLPLNVDAMNVEYVKRSDQVWQSVDQDRWIFDLDQDHGFVPNCPLNKPAPLIAANRPDS